MTAIDVLLAGAAYRISVHNPSQLPPDRGIEVAVAGRSNAGKSSLINRMCRQRSLARTSRSPGRTRQLVFFDLDDDRRLVDLPGYGYAAVSGDLKAHWGRLIADYLKRRKALAGLVVLMDTRHPLKEGDVQLIEFALDRGLPLHLVLTKADKLGRGKQNEALRQVQAAVGGMASIQLFSATTGQGLEELHRVMAAWLFPPA